MKNTSSNLVGCGCLFILAAIFGLMLGAAESSRAIMLFFDIAADVLGSRSNAATAFGVVGIVMIIIALVIELFKKTDEDLPSGE